MRTDKPIIIEDVVPLGLATAGALDATDGLERRVRKELDCHYVQNSTYHDYVTGSCARVFPTRADGETLLRVLRSAFAGWRRVTVSVQRDNNVILWTAFAKDTVTTHDMPIGRKAVASNTKPASGITDGKGNTLEELRANVGRLKALLDDPHPGLATWCECYGRAMQAVSDFWAGKGGAS